MNKKQQLATWRFALLQCLYSILLLAISFVLFGYAPSKDCVVTEKEYQNLQKSIQYLSAYSGNILEIEKLKTREDLQPDSAVFYQKNQKLLKDNNLALIIKFDSLHLHINPTLKVFQNQIIALGIIAEHSKTLSATLHEKLNNKDEKIRGLHTATQRDSIALLDLNKELEKCQRKLLEVFQSLGNSSTRYPPASKVSDKQTDSKFKIQKYNELLYALDYATSTTDSLVHKKNFWGKPKCKDVDKKAKRLKLLLEGIRKKLSELQQLPTG